MRTPNQTAASRANGAPSKGPVTEQGKRNSSRNSTRHGLLAETVVLEAENEERFLKLLNDLTEEHNPSTPTQMLLVETLAVTRWQQYRIWEMQKVAFDHDAAIPNDAAQSPCEQAVLALRASVEASRSHELLLRYGATLDRQFSRALRRLQELQFHQNPAPARERGVSSPETPETKRTQEPVENKKPTSAPKPELIRSNPPQPSTPPEPSEPRPSTKATTPAKPGNSSQNNQRRNGEQR